MKLSSEIKDYVVDGSGTEGGEVSIDTSNLSMFYEMMSKSIYANPIGSIVREITSNCFDSHIEAGVTKPVVIKFFKEEGELWISFEDFGVGISPERFKDIYLKYMSSTKRDSNDQLGMWGLGSKSPFSYTDVFYVRTRFEGIEYLYIMSKGQKGIPEWDLLYKKETTEGNGTQVKFIIEDSWHGNDFHSFKEEVKDQLMYFDDVFVECDKYYETVVGIDNDYTIYDLRTFKYRKSFKREMHILLGKVKYPIDWNFLKMEAINIPVGVKFEIGEIMITPNRESIRYNEEMAEVVRNKIKACLSHLMDIANKAKFSTLDTLMNYKEKTSKGDKYIVVNNDLMIPVYEGMYFKPLEVQTNSTTLDTVVIGSPKGNLVRELFSIPNPKFEPFVGTPLEVPDNPFFMFRTVGLIKNGKYTTYKEEDKKNPSTYKNVYKVSKAQSESASLYRTSDFKLNRMHIAYIQNGTVVSFNNSLGLKVSMKKLGLGELVKSPLAGRLLLEEPYITEKWNKTKLYKLYKEVMTQELIKVSKSYDRLDIPTEWATNWKQAQRGVRREVQDGELEAYIVADSLKMKSTLRTSKINTRLVVYSIPRNKEMLKAIDLMFGARLTQTREYKSTDGREWRETKRPLVIAINKQDFSKMEGSNKFELDELFKNRHRVLIEQATAFYILERYERLELQFALKYVPGINKWYTELKNFMKKTIIHEDFKSIRDNKFVLEILTVAKEHGLLIKEYEAIVDNLLIVQEDLRLLRVCCDEAVTFDDEKEVASFFIKKGYIVDPIYAFELNDIEKQWVKEAIQYADYRQECYNAYNKSIAELNRLTRMYRYSSNNQDVEKAYQIMINAKEPKTWQANFPKSLGNKSVKTSMLQLMASN